LREQTFERVAGDLLLLCENVSLRLLLLAPEQNIKGRLHDTRSFTEG
jgi:hypothetical protein